MPHLRAVRVVAVVANLARARRELLDKAIQAVLLLQITGRQAVAVAALRVNLPR